MTKPKNKNPRKKSQPSPKRPAKPPFFYSKKEEDSKEEQPKNMRLNQYLAHCGIANRRQAGTLVKAGEVQVNGKVEKNPAYLVQPQDEICYKEEIISPEIKKVYYLFNKPKNTTTLHSLARKGHKAVADLIKNKVHQKVFPVEQLELNTMGLLLLTNDEKVQEKFRHPSHQLKVVYHLSLDQEVEETELELLMQAAKENENLIIKGISFLEDRPKSELGIDLRKGADTELRKLFEQQGYQLKRLDRVTLGGLTKKDLPRGFVRPLKEKEVIWLKHFL